MSKEYILEKIKEISNESTTPGLQKFCKITGIKKYEINKYWETWSDALIEAGHAPNQFTQAMPQDYIIEQIVDLIREKQKFPTDQTFQVKKYEDSNFPSTVTIRDRIGNKETLVKAVIKFCGAKDNYRDVLDICQKVKVPTPSRKTKGRKVSVIGYVYLIKFGDFFKLGRSNDIDRRFREIKTKLPEEGELIHVIETDDPEGIEAYWHNRFKEERTRGEWFKLSNDDVKSFKKRKSM